MYHIISSAKEESLTFPKQGKALYDEYEAERKALIKKYKKLIREQFGIYASNQNKFVKSPSQLNEWDSKDY